MSSFDVELEKVKQLLACIDGNPDVFVGLEDKKITPAVVAFHAVSLENLSHSVRDLTNMLGRINANLIRQGFFQGPVEGEG